MDIPDDWLPTADNINALPDPLRNFVANLETNADPAGMVAENTLLKDQTRQLDAHIACLKKRIDDAIEVYAGDFTTSEAAKIAHRMYAKLIEIP